MANIKYAIIELGESVKSVFDAVIELNNDSCRRSVDGTKIIVKYKCLGYVPDALYGATIYTHSEMLTEIAKAEWSEWSD